MNILKKNNFNKIGIVLFLIVFTSIKIVAQDKFSFNGYVSNMGQTVVAKDTNGNYQSAWDLIIHNRLNLAYYANDKFTFHLQGRNQFLWGESVSLNPDYAKTFAQDRGWADLNWNWFENDNNFLNTQIDRAYVEYVNGNLEMSLGRQRVNWGRTFVWNPNDIFNAFSYYDFDYMERPGSDAFRAQYYLGMASSVEVVTKIDSANNLTFAGIGKFNKWGYDLQVLGGYVNSQDYVIGAGWEGNIKALGFRGEMSYYHSEKNFADTTGSFLASLAVDYLFPKSISAQIEFLYNDPKNILDLNNASALYQAPPDSKSLSFSEYNFFVNIVWPATPILTINIASMYYTDYKGYFLMPGIDFSITEDLYFSLIYQYFNLEVMSQRSATNLAFARIKWNF